LYFDKELDGHYFIWVNILKVILIIFCVLFAFKDIILSITIAHIIIVMGRLHYSIVCKEMIQGIRPLNIFWWAQQRMRYFLLAPTIRMIFSNLFYIFLLIFALFDRNQTPSELWKWPIMSKVGFRFQRYNTKNIPLINYKYCLLPDYHWKVLPLTLKDPTAWACHTSE